MSAKEKTRTVGRIGWTCANVGDDERKGRMGDENLDYVLLGAHQGAPSTVIAFHMAEWKVPSPVSIGRCISI